MACIQAGCGTRDLALRVAPSCLTLVQLAILASLRTQAGRLILAGVPLEGASPILTGVPMQGERPAQAGLANLTGLLILAARLSVGGRPIGWAGISHCCGRRCSIHCCGLRADVSVTVRWLAGFKVG